MYLNNTKKGKCYHCKCENWECLLKVKGFREESTRTIIEFDWAWLREVGKKEGFKRVDSSCHVEGPYGTAKEIKESDVELIKLALEV